jgi:hypothetical protein
MNLCTTCGEDFGSIESFDAHRVGNYPQRGPSEYEGSIEEWTADKGRRCLTVEEMESGSFRSRQFVRNGRGRWSLEKRLNRSRESFSIELPSPEAAECMRAAAYIRESTEEQGQGSSPHGQREAIVHGR